MSQPMIGYLLNRPFGLEGQNGQFYDYILGQNGLFLRAENNFIEARIPVARAEVRGLEPLTTRIELKHGLIPGYWLAIALRTMRQDPSREVYLAVVCEEGFYRIYQPPQQQSATRVTYNPLPATVVDLHSHGAMAAHFSGTDDQDDQGFRISGVIGRLDQPRAELEIRLGVYGYHTRVHFPEVFTGEMPTDLIMALERT